MTAVLSDPELVSHDEYRLVVQGVSPKLHEPGFAPSRLSAQAWSQYTTFICQEMYGCLYVAVFVTVRELITFLFQVDKH